MVPGGNPQINMSRDGLKPLVPSGALSPQMVAEGAFLLSRSPCIVLSIICWALLPHWQRQSDSDVLSG